MFDMVRLQHPDRAAVLACDVAGRGITDPTTDPLELGGRTDLANLLPICPRHHHLVHEHHCDELAPDRQRQRVAELQRC